jgi:colicin import membrane protein
MMSWLLKNEGYPASVMTAVLLHGILLWIIFDRNIDSREFVKIEQPSISANAVSKNPQQVKKQEKLQQQRKQQQVAREKERLEKQEQQKLEQQQKIQQEQKVQQEQVKKETVEKQKLAEQQKADVQKKAEQQKKTEQEQKTQAQETARKKQEEQKRVAQKEDARKNELAKAEAAKAQAQREEAAKAEAALQSAALSEEDQLVAQYVTIIKDLIAQNWQLPPNARNGMSAVVELRLTPTGEIVNSRITQGSGDPLFDRSVLQAVERAENFPELKELPIAVFERHFRVFSLLFQPEDLLR